MNLGSLFSTAASAAGSANPVAAVANAISGIVDKVWPDPTVAEAAKIAEMKERTSDACALLEAQNRAAVAEAGSSDAWTSRARPSFLYVMYALILWAIPMGMISAFSPATALAVAEGFKAWLAAIPSQLWDVFGLCFTVYAGSRLIEKVKGVA